MTARIARKWFDPFVEAGYAVWYVTRRRNMPPGHTVADMADDYAQVIADELGGWVDLVVGESYGGMILQFLAARHGESLGHAAIVVAAADVSEWGIEVDTRLAAALARGDRAGVGMAFSEYAFPGARSRWLRRVVGPWLARSLLSGKNYPPGDLLVETEAELAFDARPVLPRIAVPVVLLCGDSDRFFPQDLVEETVGLIPECALVTYEGQGHMKVATSRRVPQDVLAFVERT
ncbi:MAG: alpha/beta fold hydrolase [Nocardioides sp.]